MNGINFNFINNGANEATKWLSRALIKSITFRNEKYIDTATHSGGGGNRGVRPAPLPSPAAEAQRPPIEPPPPVPRAK